jgi:prepilin peptidase CpaA
MGTTSISIPLGVVLLAALVAGAFDIWRFRVPNLLTLPLLALGLIYHGMLEGLPGVGESALGVLFGGGVLIVMYAMGGLGAGDVKVMAAVGAWLGMPMTLYVFVASALAAGLYALGLVIWQGRLKDTWINLQILVYRFAAIGHHLAGEDHVEEAMKCTDRRRRFVPFAAMVAVGVIVTIAWSYWIA